MLAKEQEASSVSTANLHPLPPRSSSSSSDEKLPVVSAAVNNANEG